MHEKNVVKHWYNLVFLNSVKEGSNIVAGYFGWEERDQITGPRIETAKRMLKLPSEALLVNIMYLGYMTYEVLSGQDQGGPVTIPGDAEEDSETRPG
jgi:hypothetical protein